jgi:hypothetical protein
MLRNVKLLAVAAVAAAALFGARPAHAITQICNTGYVDFQNEVGTQISLGLTLASTCFAAESDPVLAIEKINIGAVSGGGGSTVYWEITTWYPQIADVALVCADDSDATNVTITDPIPAAFNYLPGFTEISTDNGASWSGPLTEAADADAFELVGNTVTINFGTFTEGTGDAACAGVATRRKVRFKAWKN